jgi:hypothetical protein
MAVIGAGIFHDWPANAALGPYRSGALRAGGRRAAAALRERRPGRRLPTRREVEGRHDLFPDNDLAGAIA